MPRDPGAKIQSQSRLKRRPGNAPPACACVQQGRGRSTLEGVWFAQVGLVVFVCGGEGIEKGEKRKKEKGEKNEGREKPQKKPVVAANVGA